MQHFQVNRDDYYTVFLNCMKNAQIENFAEMLSLYTVQARI